jgi:hypothetical protein
MNRLICLSIFVSLSCWRATLASLEKIEDKDESVNDATRRWRQEIGRIMAKAISHTG